MAKKPNTKVEKINFRELLNSTQGKPEIVEMFLNDPEKAKYHQRYMTPRDQVILSNGMQYTRPLATNPATDTRYHLLAREFVSNGFDKVRAYAAVYGKPLRQCWANAARIFATPGMISKINEIILGTSNGYADLPKAYLIARLMEHIDSNVLDYLANDGSVLSVEELRALPPWSQLVIKRLESWTTTSVIAVKDENGDVVKNEEGEPFYVEVKDQRVKIELYDKLKAMDTLAKAMNWITAHTEINIGLITSDMMVQANARVKQLRRDPIESEENNTKPASAD